MCIRDRQIIAQIKEAAENKAKIIVLPELCVTAYTCGDLFLQSALIDNAADAVFTIAEETKDLDILIAVGTPIGANNRLYNTAAVIKGGEILGFVTKTHIPNYSEFYEARHFASLKDNTSVRLRDRDYPCLLYTSRCV